MAWSNFDLILIGTTLLIGLKGLYNGAIRELSGLVGVTSGILLASRAAPSFGEWIAEHLFPVKSPSAMNLTAFLLLLFVTWALSIWLGVFVVKRFEPAIHTWLDRLVGFLFASLKVFVILAVIVYALSTIEFIQKNAGRYVEKSRLYPLLVTTGRTLMQLPETDDSAGKPHGQEHSHERKQSSKP